MHRTTPSQRAHTFPHNEFHGDIPLVAVRRGNYIGSVHRGVAVVADPGGHIIQAYGDAAQPVFLRSAAKPFQVIPAVLSGGIDRFGITEQELAVLCASHSAEPRHMEAVLSVLQKIGLDEGSLQCGIHPPIDQETAIARWQAGIAPSPVCNNCSGAHAGMLVACRALDFPTSGYGQPDHPLQRMTRDVLSAFTDVRAEQIEYAVDNCAVPTFRFPLLQSAMAFARLMTQECVEQPLREASTRVVLAMTSYPAMVGGAHSFDSDLMTAADGAIVSKSGAEGFQGMGLRTLRAGVAIKVSDGNARAVSPASLAILNGLGVLDADMQERLSEYKRPGQLSARGELVGDLVPVLVADSV